MPGRRDCKTTTDLGQALIDGKFDHVGKIKGPILRGLSARAPFFHNGSAQTLLDAVRFYENRFGLVLTAQEGIRLGRVPEQSLTGRSSTLGLTTSSVANVRRGVASQLPFT